MNKVVSLMQCMRSAVKRLAYCYDKIVCNNKVIKDIIYFQHSRFPIPLFFFDFLYRPKIIKRLFGFYGFYVWKYSYDKKREDNLSYWLSKESLYWHFLRQTDIDKNSLKEVLSIEEVSKIMNENCGRVAVEIGFGIGKNYRCKLRYNKFDKYIGVEPNKYLCSYVKSKYSSEKNFHVINSSIHQFINSLKTMQWSTMYYFVLVVRLCIVIN